MWVAKHADVILEHSLTIVIVLKNLPHSVHGSSVGILPIVWVYVVEGGGAAGHPIAVSQIHSNSKVDLETSPHIVQESVVLGRCVGTEPDNQIFTCSIFIDLTTI